MPTETVVGPTQCPVEAISKVLMNNDPTEYMTGTVPAWVGTDRLVVTVVAWNPVATHQPQPLWISNLFSMLFSLFTEMWGGLCVFSTDIYCTFHEFSLPLGSAGSFHSAPFSSYSISSFQKQSLYTSVNAAKFNSIINLQANISNLVLYSLAPVEGT